VAFREPGASGRGQSSLCEDSGVLAREEERLPESGTREVGSLAEVSCLQDRVLGACHNSNIASSVPAVGQGAFARAGRDSVARLKGSSDVAG
jgi:hypothetical protein